MRKIGAIKAEENVKDVVKRMKIGFNKFKDQVIIECVDAKRAEQVYLPLLDVPAAPAVDNGLGYRVTHVDAYYFREDKAKIKVIYVCAD